jgi:septal ring factor EnvC (AmiA/AmiB activator)
MAGAMASAPARSQNGLSKTKTVAAIVASVVTVAAIVCGWLLSAGAFASNVSSQSKVVEQLQREAVRQPEYQEHKASVQRQIEGTNRRVDDLKQDVGDIKNGVEDLNKKLDGLTQYLIDDAHRRRADQKRADEAAAAGPAR